MKLNHIFAILASVTLIAAMGCKQPPPDPPTGTIELRFIPTLDGAAFSLGDSYTATDGKRFRVDFLKYFLSNVYLDGANNTQELVKDVALVDETDPSTHTISATVPTGDYNAVSFGVGLDAATNATDPASVTIDHPLSSTTGMYWTWASKYIFLKFEGYADTSGTSGPFEHAFLYHCGLDALYGEKTISRSITVSENAMTTVDIGIDLKKVLHNDTDPIDVTQDHITHAVDDFDLAERVTTNFLSAFE